MKTATLLLILVLFLSSFYKPHDRIRLIFEEEKTMRSSFCMYSDGKFYEARASGCVGQEFASGYWENENDTITLVYRADNVFDFEILKSEDTANKYQIVKVIDCYNQPVRFQNVCFDTTCQNLYNPGILSIEKGKSIWYSAPIFEQTGKNSESIFCNADTITYKWNCNRESIESISGGTLFFNQESTKKKIKLRNKKIISLPRAFGVFHTPIFPIV
jgi:hypothetical protein